MYENFSGFFPNLRVVGLQFAYVRQSNEKIFRDIFFDINSDLK
jgi:hypothetical protein